MKRRDHRLLSAEARLRSSLTSCRVVSIQNELQRVGVAAAQIERDHTPAQGPIHHSLQHTIWKQRPHPALRGTQRSHSDGRSAPRLTCAGASRQRAAIPVPPGPPQARGPLLALARAAPRSPPGFGPSGAGLQRAASLAARGECAELHRRTRGRQSEQPPSRLCCCFVLEYKNIQHIGTPFASTYAGGRGRAQC